MNTAKLLLVPCVVLLFTCCLLASGDGKDKEASASTASRMQPDKMKEKAAEAEAFCRKKQYSTDFCLLADMNIHSGYERMVVWNFITDTVERSLLVGHGCGQD